MGPFLGRFRLRSTLMHMILIFMMTLIPIFLMGLTIYRVGVAKLDSQIRHSLEQQFEFKGVELAGQMALAQEQMRQLVDENGMLRLSGRYEMMNNYERYHQLNQLQERMETIYDANPFVGQIELFLPRLNWYIKAIRDDDGLPVVQKIDESALERYRTVGALMPGCTVLEGDDLVYMGQMPLGIAIGGEKLPRVLYVIHYDREHIDAYFARTLAETRVGYMLLFSDGTRMTGGDMDEAAWCGGGDLSDAQTYAYNCTFDELGLRLLICTSRLGVFSELNEFRTILYALLALFLAAIPIYIVRTYRDVHAPLKLLTDGFRRLAGGDMDFQLTYSRNNEFGYLTEHFNRMLWQLKDTISQMYRQRILMQQAQIKQLQAQINPHFLYNSFYILESMINMEDCEAASMFSRRLGQYFRYVTRDARDQVTLAEELDHVRSYVEIQRIRFGRRLELEFPENPPEAERVILPRLTLQPILENTFVHALEHCAHGSLAVRLIPEEGWIRVEVENDHFVEPPERIAEMQRGLDDEDPNREVTGLMNVHRRLKLTQHSGLVFRKVEPDRLLIVLRLRMEGEET